MISSSLLGHLDAAVDVELAHDPLENRAHALDGLVGEALVFLGGHGASLVASRSRWR